jgi:molybdopterin/thiamine biosynthesis adenylyltransferase
VTREDATRLLFDVVRARHLDRVGVVPSQAGVLATVSGERTYSDRCFRFEVRLPDAFPARLPTVVALDAPPLPHVEEDGSICAFEREGLSLSRERPAELIDEAVCKALATFEDGVRGTRWAELYDELPQYWCRGVRGRRADAFLDLEGPSRLVDVGWVCPRKRTMRVLFVADRQGDASMRDYPELSKAITLSTARVPYLRLPESLVHEPLDVEALRSVEGLLTFLEGCGARPELDRLTRLSDRLRPLVVLGFPRARLNERTPVLLQFGTKHGSIEKAAERGTPWTLARLDRESLLGRGGSRSRDAHVAIVGCGSVGGQLATQLASTGVSRLTLIDPDRFEAANVYRHVLGRADIGRRKVDALADDLRRRPYLDVDVAHEPAQKLLVHRLHRDQFDAIVVTIGDVTQSRELQELLRDYSGIVMFTWLEPLGIGGHALTRPAGAKGCYECLFRREDGSEQVDNRSDFAAPGQTFTRSVTGCGGAYTPYSVLDATQTALLASRALVEALDSRSEAGPRVAELRSWRGDSRAYLDAGFRLSDRWEARDGSTTWFARERCPVCGSKP